MGRYIKILFLWQQNRPGMPVFSYRTIQHPVTGTFKEKGSKFLAFAYPVNSEVEIKEQLADLKKKYFDARHLCYAWTLGAEKKLFRAFDDGEPNHSAGDPILGQIRSKNITNVLLVVVRYFGGVKLGVSGLINAYRNAAEDALIKAAIVEKDVVKIVTLQYDYTATPYIMRLIKELELTILSQKFDAECILEIQVSLRDSEALTEKISFLQATGTAVRILITQ